MKRVFLLGIAATAGLSSSLSARAASTAYALAVTADSPYVYYRLGETSGTVATDASGNGRNGTYVNVASADLGKPGSKASGDTATMFNGSNAYVASPTAASGFGASIGTSSYELVFKVNSGFSVTATTTAIFGFAANKTQTNGTNSTAASIALNQTATGVTNTSTTAPTAVAFFRDQAGNSVRAAFSELTITDGNYHDLIVTYGGARNIGIYVDGVSLTFTPSGAGGSGTYYSDMNPYFAASNGRGTPSGFAPITLDEASIYTSILSQDSISAHAAAAVPEPEVLGVFSMGCFLSLRRRR